MIKREISVVSFVCILTAFLSGICIAGSIAYDGQVYDPGHLKPVDSHIKVKEGDRAPDFTLPSVAGKPITLSRYKGKKNVMLSFIPAAWTPVCSDQWPGYNIARPFFDKTDTVIIGISTNSIPTLYAWIRKMGSLWFDVVSDFWPHGAVSSTYGVLRSDGTAERAIILIDKQGIIRFVHVGDINVRPDLKMIVDQLNALIK